ncbi:MAG: hypothetical protein AVDCRST_MAG96-2180 [uncultured Segetibacter sp.]|uniref:Uncharacterized protein n=1 Tax=uncultured Segetibacter sp. TaxID=481133 RepID=A0A6J4STY8_9BACT|nr:MAG: hypothetical protein AVDCRST_MAG96-2180 [uncultured Segetibacter sp.]
MKIERWKLIIKSFSFARVNSQFSLINSQFINSFKDVNSLFRQRGLHTLRN